MLMMKRKQMNMYRKTYRFWCWTTLTYLIRLITNFGFIVWHPRVRALPIRMKYMVLVHTHTHIHARPTFWNNAFIFPGLIRKNRIITKASCTAWETRYEIYFCSLYRAVVRIYGFVKSTSELNLDMCTNDW